MIDTAKRRCTLSNIFNDDTLIKIIAYDSKYGISILTPLDFRINLPKHDNQEHIQTRFPSLINMNYLHNKNRKSVRLHRFKKQEVL